MALGDPLGDVHTAFTEALGTNGSRALYVVIFAHVAAFCVWLLYFVRDLNKPTRRSYRKHD